MKVEEKIYIEALEERDSYKRAFEACLRWLDRDYAKDAASDEGLDPSYDDSYKRDMYAIRAGRRKVEAK